MILYAPFLQGGLDTMKNIMTYKAISNMVCTITLLLPLQLGIGLTIPEKTGETADTIAVVENESKEEPVLRHTNVVLLDLEEKYCDTKCYLTQNIETVNFLSKTIGIDKDIVINELIQKNANAKFIETNIGRLTDENGELKEYNSFERGLIEYLFNYAKNNPKLVNNTRVAYDGDAEYVVKLIKYFTDIYDNVDYLTAVSIGAAESGYYKVKYMLHANNIYGGMSNSGLVRHKSIEYGVLSYIRLLSNNYYSKGLNTLESIGKIYCPTYSASGVKVASPHWINLVNKAKSVYSKTENETISVSILING